MNKKIVLIGIALILLVVSVVGIVRPSKEDVKSVGGLTAGLKRVASSTHTYFGDNFDGTRTATSTLLFVDRDIYPYQRIGLVLESVATGTTAQVGEIYALPQLSYDADEWYDWTPPVVATPVTTGATGLLKIQLPQATS